MKSKRILVVDDEPQVTRLFSEFLSVRGMKPTVCLNGLDALEEFKKEPFPIVITDIEMPLMNGVELIENIKAINDETVVIILSAGTDTSVIVKTIKLGAYDYIVKPMDMDDVFLKIQHAEESAMLKKTERIIQREKQLRLENQLEWYRWQEKLLSKRLDVNDASLFEGLRRSFTQGAGFGMILTMFDIIFTNSADKGEGLYRIDPEILKLLSDNVIQAKKSLKTFNDIESLDKDVLEVQEITVEEVYILIGKIIKRYNEIAARHNKTISMSSIKKSFSNRRVAVNSEYMDKMINEIIMNALKFSPNASSITVIMDIVEDSFLLEVMNVPLKNREGITGVPEEYENIIFEPFFRITKALFEEYGTFDYGIGLTMCDKIAAKINGSIRLFNVTDHSDLKTGPQIKVCCEVQIPLC